MPLQYLKDLWDEGHAHTLEPPALLRYRSNLLGSEPLAPPTGLLDERMGQNDLTNLEGR